MPALGLFYISVTASAGFSSLLEPASCATVSNLIHKEQYERQVNWCSWRVMYCLRHCSFFLGGACMCTLSPCIYRSNKIRTLKKLDKNLSVQAHAAYL